MILQIETRQLDPGITVVELAGRMSLGTQLSYAEDRISILIAGGVRKMILDLKALHYVDSSAIGVLVMLFGNMAKLGGQMRLAGPTQMVGKILTIAHLHKILPIDPDVAASSQAFEKASATGA